MKRLEQAWYNHARWPLLLQPLEQLYLKLSAQDQRKKQAQQWQAPVPVLIVGNITVGGTGKSPLVATLVDYLRSKGWKPGIVSRGYGGKSSEYPLSVTTASDPKIAGDEPVMLAQLGCPVVVDPKRSTAAQSLLAEHDCDLIISDDGLQHLALGRDIELVVIDAARGLGNGHCLPVGPLREPKSRLQQVDYIFANGAEHTSQLEGQTLHPMQLKPTQWRQPASQATYPIQPLPFNESVQALAGIGNPERFFNTLRQLGLTVTGRPYPDHYQFQAQDLVSTEPLLMTAKDAVKCQAWLGAQHWVLDVRAHIATEILEQIHLDLLAAQARKQTSQGL
ncbi:tetraacyldisaccharide 4'-kinase [Oceanospirillum multiglobuliferum]|uniref:Tetraacyldisaccharide 4'-kinase n=1 Tax=Oceanospirillum multiglobuliferum TaxID=64969 RepID=A0A1V4T7Q4_9GAMM|nr:tetraacyldisaccharide 4'-kinase [Oceanospirillum multiglobuliferum]